MASVHRLKIKLLVRQGISEKVATEEVLEQLIKQNEYMDGKLAECIGELDALQVDKIFGMQIEDYENELAHSVAAGLEIYDRRKENEHEED